MNYAKRCSMLLIVSSFYIVALMAQSTITSSGSNATGSGGSVSYTIGQIIYQTIFGTNGSVAQGVQQPYEISVVTAVENTEGITLDYKVYPNPTGGIITLSIKPFSNENFRFRLYDLNGIILQDKKVESGETVISMESFSSATYFLKVFKNNVEVKTFKIIKR